MKISAMPLAASAASRSPKEELTHWQQMERDAFEREQSIQATTPQMGARTRHLLTARNGGLWAAAAGTACALVGLAAAAPLLPVGAGIALGGLAVSLVAHLSLKSHEKKNFQAAADMILARLDAMQAQDQQQSAQEQLDRQAATQAEVTRLASPQAGGGVSRNGSVLVVNGSRVAVRGPGTPDPV